MMHTRQVTENRFGISLVHTRSGIQKFFTGAYKARNTRGFLGISLVYKMLEIKRFLIGAHQMRNREPTALESQWCIQGKKHIRNSITVAYKVMNTLAFKLAYLLC